MNKWLPGKRGWLWLGCYALLGPMLFAALFFLVELVRDRDGTMLLGPLLLIGSGLSWLVWGMPASLVHLTVIVTARRRMQRKGLEYGVHDAYLRRFSAIAAVCIGCPQALYQIGVSGVPGLAASLFTAFAATALAVGYLSGSILTLD